MANLHLRVAQDESLTALSSHPEIDPDIDALFAATDNEWAVSRATAQFLARLVTAAGRRSVLEYGAGTSSLIFSTALSKVGGGRLTSIEHQPEYATEKWHQAERVPGVNAKLNVARLRLQLSRHGTMYGYDVPASALAERAPYDLVLIDAPPGIYGRDAPLYQAFDYLAPGALIVLDDAGRPAEQTAVRRWLDTFPGMTLVLYDERGRGTAVLRHDGRKVRRIVPRAILGTLHDRWADRQRQSE